MKSRGKGYMVKLDGDKFGRTYHENGTVNGKIPVYLQDENGKYADKAILFPAKRVEHIGFID